MPIRYASGCIGSSVEYMTLESKEYFKVGYRNFRGISRWNIHILTLRNARKVCK